MFRQEKTERQDEWPDNYKKLTGTETDRQKTGRIKKNQTILKLDEKCDIDSKIMPENRSIE